MRYSFALLSLVAVLGAWGLVGCDLLMPLALPQPAAPDLKAPDAPQGPDLDDGGGACCIRGTAPVEQECGAGVERCCSTKHDRDKCEEMNGAWFHSARGCKGAC